MANGLPELIARLKETSATTVQVIIPRGAPVTLSDGIHFDADLYEIPASLFVSAQPDPDLPDEREMVAAVTLNIRGVPERTAVLLGTLQTGERVKVKGSPTNGYAKLAGRDGYVLAEGLAPIT